VASSPGVDRRPPEEESAALHDAVPHQPRHAAGVLTGKVVPDGVRGPGRSADWADAVDAVHAVAGALAVGVEHAAAGRAPWHPGQCAAVSAGERVVGSAGQLHPRVVAAFDLPPGAVAFELDLDALTAAAGDQPVQPTPVSTYPPGKEDIALVVDDAVPAAEVLAVVREGAAELGEEVRLFDVYTGEQLGEGKKSLAFALRLRAADRTLTAEETAAVRERIVTLAAERVGAVLRG